MALNIAIILLDYQSNLYTLMVLSIKLNVLVQVA